MLNPSGGRLLADRAGVADALTSPGKGARSLGEWSILAMLLAAAIAASSQRIVAAPGFEFYLGPLFYLTAYRVYGLRVGILVAAAVMAPTYFWWNHPYSIILAMTHVLLVHQAGSRLRSLGLVTLGFYLTIGAAANWAILGLVLDAPGSVILLTGARKAINDVMSAAIVDVVCATFAVDPRNFTISRRRAASFGTLTLALAIVVAVGTAAIVLISDIREFQPRLADFQRDTLREVALQSIDRHYRGFEVQGRLTVYEDDNNSHIVYIGRRPADVTTSAIKEQLDCKTVDDGRPLTGANDRSTFVYWLFSCKLQRFEIGGESYWMMSSRRTLALSSYERSASKLLVLVPILVFGVLVIIWLTRLLSQSLVVWRETVARFGTPDLTIPPKIAIAEFVQPIASFVDANNIFMSLLSQRRVVIEAMSELSAAISLRLIADISFDAATGELCFAQLRFDGDATPVRLLVNPADRIELTNAATNPGPSMEIRVSCRGEEHWHLLIARDRVGNAQWKSGCLMRLQQPKFEHDRMLQQARLIELGGMASALSHELKQPLFTIALAAENGSFQLAEDDRPNAAKALAKFDRIIEQVERARAIIGRISRYARIDAAPNEVFDLIDGISTATSFLRPMLIAENVGVRITNCSTVPIPVMIPRVGLEQLIVNAIQNAVDAIGTRRDGDTEGFDGEIVISCCRDADGITVTIADNGTGLILDEPESAFDAFMTTKGVDKGTGLGLYISRQILLEIGGTIAIASRPRPAMGAIVTIAFPLAILVGEPAPPELISDRTPA